MWLFCLFVCCLSPDRTKYKEKVIKMLLKYNIVKPEQVSVLPRRSSVSSHKTNILTSHPSRHHSQSSEKVEIKGTTSFVFIITDTVNTLSKIDCDFNFC
jgi:hypothetical protein